MGVCSDLFEDARCGGRLHLAVFLSPGRPCCVHPSPGGQALRSAVEISCLRAGLLEELYLVVVALFGSLDLSRAGQRLVAVLRHIRERQSSILARLALQSALGVFAFQYSCCLALT